MASAPPYAQKMKRVAWVGISAGLALAVFGFVAGTVGDFRENAAPTTAADVCSPVPAGLKALNLAIGNPGRGIDLTFDSPSSITGLRGPLNGLTIIRAEVDGPEFEAEGDVSIWAVGPGSMGTSAGVWIYALNPVARRVDGRSTWPGKYLRTNFDSPGEAEYDPRVVRAIASAVAAWCVN